MRAKNTTVIFVKTLQAWMAKPCNGWRGWICSLLISAGVSGQPYTNGNQNPKRKKKWEGGFKMTRKTETKLNQKSAGKKKPCVLLCIFPFLL